MMYLWVRRGKEVNKIVSISEENWKEFSRNMYMKGYYFTKLPSKPPAERTLRRWNQTGKAKSIAGNWVDGWSNDHQNAPSWLRVCNKKKKVLTAG